MAFRRISILLIVAVALTAQAQNVTAELSKMFSYNSSAPLDLQKRVFDHQPSATIYDIDFASPKDGRVTGFLVLPTSSGLHPRHCFWALGTGRSI
jgi:cephalosporin-C deacetylase-like acetyl esterase